MTQTVDELVKKLREFPGELKNAFKGLDFSKITTVCPLDSWTIAQIVHHLADVQMNKFSQIRATFDESNVHLDSYAEANWVNLPGGNDPNLKYSLAIIESINMRLISLIKNASNGDLNKAKEYAQLGAVTLAKMLDRFFDHGFEHLDQIKKITQSFVSE